MDIDERLAEIETTFLDVEAQMSQPGIADDLDRLRDMGRRYAELRSIVEPYREYLKLNQALHEAEEIAQSEDVDMAQMAREEVEVTQDKIDAIRTQLEASLIPKDPNDDKNVVVEIRGGAGGQEAALWAGELYELYRRFGERQHWKTEILSSSPSDLGGYKEVVFEIRGQGAFSRLKHESGVHRVQRVPVTESQGRIHTSTATVAVLAEAEDVDIAIEPGDLRIDVFRGTGPGGQSVNTTDSAVRITHLPTGIAVTCTEERSQLQNKEKAMRYLRARLLADAQEAQAAEEAATRRAQVGSGERAEKIRTYNFPEGRVTDHRLKLTVHQLADVLDGGIDEFVDALMAVERSQRLASGT